MNSDDDVEGVFCAAGGISFKLNMSLNVVIVIFCTKVNKVVRSRSYYAFF